MDKVYVKYLNKRKLINEIYVRFTILPLPATNWNVFKLHPEMLIHWLPWTTGNKMRLLACTGPAALLAGGGPENQSYGGIDVTGHVKAWLCYSGQSNT